MQNTATISSIVAPKGVDALMFSDTAIQIADKSYNAEFNQQKYQPGSTIYFRIEDQPGQMAQQQSIKELPIYQRQRSLTVLPYNFGLNVGAAFQMLDIGTSHFEKRIAIPYGKRVAEQFALTFYDAAKAGMNFYGTPGTAVKTATDFASIQAILASQDAQEDLFVCMTPQSLANVAGDVADKFNPTKVSSLAYTSGRVQECGGLNFYTSPLIPTHTNGSAVANGATGMVLASVPAFGATSITVSGGTSSGTITKNSLIWFGTNSSATQGFAVEPSTKVRQGTLRYFTVAADVTLSGGGGVITLTEPIWGPATGTVNADLAGKIQNISVDLSTQYVGIVGTASHTYEQMFWMKKNSIALCGLDQPDLIKLENDRSEFEGLTIRYTSGGDISGFNNIFRWDILTGATILQPYWVGRSFVRDVT